MGFMAFIMSMPSCMAFMCSTIRASRSAGVLAAAILVRSVCIVAMCCCMCSCICGIDDMPMGMPAWGVVGWVAVLVAEVDGWCWVWSAVCCAAAENAAPATATDRRVRIKADMSVSFRDRTLGEMPWGHCRDRPGSAR